MLGLYQEVRSGRLKKKEESNNKKKKVSDHLTPGAAWGSETESNAKGRLGQHARAWAKGGGRNKLTGEKEKIGSFFRAQEKKKEEKDLRSPLRKSVVL